VRRIFTYLFKFAFILAGVYVIAVMALFFIQRQLIYHPDPTRYIPANHRLTGVEEVILKTSDGESIVAWYSPPKPGKPTLLYFHGNAGGLLTRSDRISLFTDAGYGVFMAAYRGYSGSTGLPSEKAIIADAALAYDYLIKQGVPAERLLLYGESLGTGVAVQIAAAHSVAAMVLDSPYTSLVDVAKGVYPIVPVELLMVDRFDSKAYISRVHVPILIMHGEKDVVVPTKLSEKLFMAANEPKERVVIPEAEHSDIYNFGAFATLQRFLNAHLK
jgi:fermentation-respiration switch protein FrsA (DUF1100 family)